MRSGSPEMERLPLIQSRPADKSDLIAYFQPLIVPTLVVLALVLRRWHVRHGLPRVRLIAIQPAWSGRITYSRCPSR